MKEQIKILLGTAKSYKMLAEALRDAGNISCAKIYLQKGKECCQMAIKIEREWSEDATKEYTLAS